MHAINVGALGPDNRLIHYNLNSVIWAFRVTLNKLYQPLLKYSVMERI